MGGVRPAAAVTLRDMNTISLTARIGAEFLSLTGGRTKWASRHSSSSALEHIFGPEIGELTTGS